MSDQLYKNRSFLCVWTGNVISELGGALGTFCLSIMVYHQTESTIALGSMWLLYFLPSLLMQLFIGPFIDRWSRKKIMIYSQWIRGCVFFLPLCMLLMNQLHPWHVFIAQMVIGLITPLYTPANQSILPTLVTQKQLSQANASVGGTVRIMTLIGPFLGGIFIEKVSVAVLLIIISCLFIFSGALLCLIRENKVVHHVGKAWLHQLAEGFSFFFAQKRMVWLGVFLGIVQFGVGVTMVTTLPYITKVLPGTYALYGIFMAGFPLGYVLGTMLVGKLQMTNRRKWMLGSLVVGGSTYILLGIMHQFNLALVAEIVAGVVMAIFSVQNITIVQHVVPEYLMGRVSSVRLLIIRGMMPIGIVAGGVMSDLWGIRLSYMIIGSIICVSAACGLILPYFQFLNEEAGEEKIAS